MTVRGPDVETIDAYLAAKPGFDVRAVDGRLWVFKSGCEHLVQFEAVGEPAKHVTRPGVGPQGQTVKSPDAETIDEYTVAQAGYETVIDDGRLWVFRAGSEEATEYHEVGEPAKHVTRPGAGPLGMTIKAPDTDTLDSYLRRVDK